MDFLPDSGEDSCCESGAKMTKKSRRTHSPAFKAPAGHFKFLRVWSVKFLHPRGRTRDC
ncbi:MULTISPECIES: hypothetical protein [Bradyrhizobium]|uniref:hypothetical protein n=1 Tax=Bradyrhizobium sp. USDA 241 TaxID=3377725 RepID=UPI003C787A12